jgi:hypothetical protein
MVSVSIEKRARLLDASPDVFYVTSRYVKHPAVLVRLAKASGEALRNVLASAWMFASEKASSSGAPPDWTRNDADSTGA